ncbi:MAG: glycosyltransferase [Coriobacteriia bacterium]
MRVAYINKYYPPHLGGIEYHLRDLAEAAAARGVDARVLVSNESGEEVEETLGGVRVRRLPRAFAASSTPVAPRMRRAIREEAREADIFHLHFPYPWGEVSWLAAGAPGPSVMTYHSDIVRQKAGLAAYRPFLLRVMAKVDAIVASSPIMARESEFLASFPEKVRVIPFGIHVERFQATEDVLARARELREGHERPVVLFVGRLIYYKGVDILVRAMSDVDADLVLVGSGPLEGRLREMVSAHGLGDRVTFIQRVDERDLVAWYHAADVFCLPSVARSEAFGLVQLEAHAAGTPVVSTRLTTGVPFVNEHGVTGLTVEPKDPVALAEALSRLVSDAELRERLGAQARERALRDFTHERMVDETLALYDELLAAAPARGGGGGA